MGRESDIRATQVQSSALHRDLGAQVNGVEMRRQDLEKPAVSVVGLGKLGAPLAAALASKGFPVIGVDLNPSYVNSINKGMTPVQEPGLQELVQRAHANLRGTSDLHEAVSNTTITCVVVPTPSKPDGAFSLEYVASVARRIGEALRIIDRYHLVTLISTVMPGDTEKIQSVIEQSASKSCGDGFGLCYSPEFIALGRVIHGILNPDLVLIGESDSRAGDRYAAMILGLVDNRPPVARMNFVNAELAKLAINAYVTTKITYANMLAWICDRSPGADVTTVTDAVGLDSRIGPKYLRGALAYGGPCFPRDNLAFSVAAKRVGAQAPLAEATHNFNLLQTQLLADKVRDHLEPGGRIAVLGLAYKPDTPVVEESPSLLLIERLAEAGYEVCAYDPMAAENARSALSVEIAWARSWQEAMDGSDLTLIMTPWEEFRGIGQSKPKGRDGGAVIIDAWRILDRSSFEGTAEIVYLGVGPSGSQAEFQA